MAQLSSLSKGSRLLPSILDHIGTNTPNRIFASVPRTHDIGDGFRDITFGEILRAVDALATWLSKTFGVSEDFETLAYTGVADLRYTIFFYAVVKCGYKALLPSSRNPTPQNISLLQQTGCTKFFHSSELTSLAKELQRSFENELLQTVELADFDHWLNQYENPYPFTKSFEEARLDPILVLHSSGSTGAPKPITQTHQYFANCDRTLPQIPGRQNGGEILWNYEGGGYFLCPFPPYHLAGFISYIYHPVFGKSCSLLLGFPDRPALPELVLRMMQQKRVRLLFTPPSIVEGLLTLDGAVDVIEKLDDIVYAGGPLEKSAGDKLATMTRLSPIYGATETATITCLVQPPETWQYMEFHPAWKVIMEPEIDGAFELILRKDAEADQYRGIGGTILREKPEYRTRDLFLPHPDRAGLWRFYGRNDDIIVFSNGQKWNPIPSENIIRSHGEIAGVMIIGDGKFQPAVIIEPKKIIVSPEEFINSIWPLVEEANDQSQSFGRLTRSKVAVVQPGDFVRAPKGTIVRSTTAKRLNAVIDQLYLAPEAVAKDSKPTPSQPIHGKPDILQILRESAHSLSKFSTVSDEDDLFYSGLDSLMALELSTSIKSGLSKYFDPNRLSFISVLLVFRLPNIKKLAEAISHSLSSEVIDGIEQTYEKDIESLIETYTSAPSSLQAVLKAPLHVGLVGSTGFLGKELLRNLAQRQGVAKITCIDRKSSAHEVHDHFLASAKTSASIEFKTMSLTDMSVEEMQTYKDLFANMNVLVFSAWTVNFNQPLAFFEPQIRALSALCTVLVSCVERPRLFFISSISSSFSEHTIYENVSQNPSAPMSMGYAQSKYVAERVVAEFSKRKSLRATILRLGQIAGPVVDDNLNTAIKSNSSSTVWNEREWFPSVIKTSAILGLLPSDLEFVDWIPVNYLANCIGEIVDHDLSLENPGSLQVYNIVNPNRVSWSSLVPGVKEAMDPAYNIVSFAEWISALRAKEGEDQAAEKYPALKIIDYLQARLDEGGRSNKIVVNGAKKASPTLSELKPVSDIWVRQWLSSWGLTPKGHDL